jgi:HEAT repeat protein
MGNPNEKAAEEALVSHALSRGYLAPAAIEQARARLAASPGTPFLAVLAAYLPPESLPELRALYNARLVAPAPVDAFAAAASSAHRTHAIAAVESGHTERPADAGKTAPATPAVEEAPAPVVQQTLAPTPAATNEAATAEAGPVSKRMLIGVSGLLCAGLAVAITALVLAVPEPDPMVVRKAREGAIALLSSPEVKALPDARDLLAKLASAGPIDRALLRDLASGALPGVRLNAACVLGVLRDPQAKKTLEALAKNEDPLVALVALDRLAQVNENRPHEPLVMALAAERAEIRLYAIRALGEVGGGSALDALVSLADDDDPDVRVAAIQAALAIDPTCVSDLMTAGATPMAIAQAAGNDDLPANTYVELESDEPEDDATFVNDEASLAFVDTPPADDTPAKPAAAPPATPVKPIAKPAKPVAKPAKPPPGAKEARDGVRKLLAAERYAQALKKTTTELTRFPNDAELLRLQGRSHLGMGNPKLAQVVLHEAINQAPDLAVAYFDLAATYSAKKQKKNAVGALGMALRLGFSDIALLRSDPNLEEIKATKPFRALMGRFFNSTRAAEPDPADRLDFSCKQLKALFKRERDPYLRALEIVRFPEAGGIEATKFLGGLLRTKALIERMAVAEIVGKTNDPVSMAYLCEQASSKLPPRQKIPLLWALGALKSDDAFLPLLTALGDKNKDVRLAAVRSIGNHPDKRSVDPLIAMLEKVKPKDGVVINEALGKITGEDLGLEPIDWRNWWTAHPDTKIGPVRNPCSELSAPVTVATPSGFSDRYGKSKKRALKRNGGGKHTEASVTGALKWLARHQSKPGNWDTDQWAMQCSEKKPWERVTKVRKRRWDVRNTGLSLMAFLGAGHTHMGGAYPRVVRRALEWLKKRQTAAGHFSGDHHPHGYSHAAATIAMCEAYLMTRDCHLKQSAQKGINWIVRRQHSNGGWGWTTEESYTSLTSWYMVALNTAYEAGLDVPTSAIVSVRHYLDKVTSPAPKAGTPAGFAYEVYKPNTAVGEGLSVVDHAYVRSGGGAHTTTLALWCRLFSGQTPADIRVQGALNSLGRALPGVGAKTTQVTERLFFGSQAALITGGKLWATWNPALQKGLLTAQVKELCERGTWAPANDYGRVFATALGALTLESYYRFRKPISD